MAENGTPKYCQLCPNFSIRVTANQQQISQRYASCALKDDALEAVHWELSSKLASNAPIVPQRASPRREAQPVVQEQAV